MERRSLGSSLLVPSVQELAKEQILEVPSRYVRTDQDPVVTSWLTSARPEVPIIDMQRLLTPDSADYELERLHLACRDWVSSNKTFLWRQKTKSIKNSLLINHGKQLINHGLSDSLLEKLKAETQEFFNLPLDEKNKYWQQVGDIEGFGQAFVLSEEQKLDWADMFYLVTLPHDIRRPHLFPKLPLPFRLDSHLVQSEALVGNDRRPRETWVGSLSQTGFTGNFTVVPTGGWVTGFSPELMVDSGYSRSTLFVQWVPRECSGLSLLAVQKKKNNITFLIYSSH
ncbi:putative codeine 3-O-demethylase [Helianthus anomalus]